MSEQIAPRKIKVVKKADRQNEEATRVEKAMLKLLTEKYPNEARKFIRKGEAQAV